MVIGKATLLQHHRNHLHGSALSDEVIAARGYRTVMRPSAGDSSSRELLKRAGIPGWARADDARYPGILIPLYRATGEHISFQYRPDAPPKDPRTGKTRKYAAQSGRPNVLDVHPFNRDKVVDPTVELWITEGVKKGDALTTAGACVVTLSGVFNWRRQLGTLGDWEDIPLKGRNVVVCFDADATTNLNVAKAMERLGKWLHSKGAKVRFIVVPPKWGHLETKGADDFLAAHGTLDQLRKVATDAAPVPLKERIELSDAVLAQDAADEALDDYRWARGLGWLAWDGRRWQRVPDEEVRERVRLWVVAKFRDAAHIVTDAAEGGAVGEVKKLAAIRDAWFTYLNRSRIEAVAALARGVALTDAADFDAHPDLLNAGNGVVDLTTGRLLPHDPELLLTKLAPVNYDPHAKHPDWDAALTALPEDVRDWYQVRCGQAVTGHMTPDDLLIVQQGGGENGKTTLMTGIGAALGDYHTLISHRALLGDPSQHPTELMAFRGARLALLEETPEERRLSVVRLKTVVGTPQMQARYIRQDEVTFDATHSLFLSTNHKPVIEETDHGTWRRLALLTFPYRFRKPGEKLEGPLDRPGDPTLRDRVKYGTDGQHAAALAWLVQGATKWHAAGKVMPPLPERVIADTRGWRADSDLILGYLDERIVFDDKAHVMSTEVRASFNEWVSSRGHRSWSERTFADRFGGHSEIVSRRVVKKITRGDDGVLSRPVSDDVWSSLPPVPKQYRAWLGVRFRTDDDDEKDQKQDAADQQKDEAVTGVTGDPVNAPCTRGFGGYGDYPSHPSHNPADLGPCGRCHRPTVRYGPNGRALCPECRAGVSA